MKDEFTYYTVSWILEKEIKTRKFYDKKEALKWNELLPEEQRYSLIALCFILSNKPK